MTNTSFHTKAKFKTAIRLAFSEICRTTGTDPFGPVPGNDPKFHEIIDSIAEQLEDHMYDLIEHNMWE